MPDILIVYASRDGHTRQIVQRMQARLDGQGMQVRVVEVAMAADLDPSAFRVVAVGGSVVYGKHDIRLARFLTDNAERLADCQTVFFSVNLIARKAEKRTIEGNVYVRKFLDALPLSLDHVEIIAGKLDYPSYGFLDRIMIQLTMKFTDGPTDSKTVIDYTDYDQVDAFADRLATMARASVHG
ncbi:MAG: menaquinone-dependent protoporphyrinogen IX dehydrogenase [Wenzhouxiangella sp.]